MKLDSIRTALLTLDFQQGIVGMVAGAEGVVANAIKAVDAVRKSQLQVIHVGLGFAEGHPEVPDFDSPFSRAKKNNLFVKGSPSAEFVTGLVQPSDLVVHKQRVSAFSDNSLQMILRARGIDHLVFFGVSTSGIVLSTIRRAFDLDFRSVILKDACFDPDEEVHRVLTEKVFPKQATVTTVDAFIAEQGWGA